MDLVTMKQARQRVGTSYRTLGRLVKDGQITVYVDPLDRRLRLVNPADLVPLTKPRPLPQRPNETPETPSAA